MISRDPATRRRERVVTIALAILFGGLAFFWLFMITGGLLIAVAAALVALAVVGGVHYLLWGRELNHETGAPRREPDEWSEAP